MNFTLPYAGILFLNVTGSSCLPAPAKPAGRVTMRHSFYGFRPARTYLYGEFDQRTWTAYVGMGNETSGVALAGESSPCVVGSHTAGTMQVQVLCNAALCCTSLECHSQSCNATADMTALI